MENITATITGKYWDDENTQIGLEDMLIHDLGYIDTYQFDGTDTFTIFVSLKKLTYDRWYSFGFSIVDSNDWLFAQKVHNDNDKCYCDNCYEKYQDKFYT